VSSHRQRLARLAASQARRDGKYDLLASRHQSYKNGLIVGRLIRDGLIRLGIDPERARAISRVERTAADLAALTPLPPDYVPPPLQSTERGRATVAHFKRQYERFLDPATPAPDLDHEAHGILLAYVLARAPPEAVVRYLQARKAAEACDVARTPPV
jgi:hypothetical protein